MLIILLNWLFIFFTTYTLGYAGLSLMNRLISKRKNTQLPIVLFSLTGLAVITTLANYFSLFSKIGPGFIIFISGLSLMSCIVLRNSILSPFKAINVKNIHPLVVIFGVGFFLIALIKASGPTEIWDEGQYFLPLIRWIENFPVIPGSALFHDRMGYNSAFHMSNAVYSFAFWFRGGLYDLNAFLFVLINFYFLGGVNRIIRKEVNWKFHDYLMLFAGIALYRQLLTSMDADYPHIFIGLVILFTFLAKVEMKSLKIWDERSNVLLFVSIYLVTVKFLAIYYLLFIGVLLWFQIKQKHWRIFWTCFIIGFLSFCPWLARNVIMTGYLVYPLYQFDFFPVDWKVPLEMARNNYLYVGEHAKTLVERHSLFYDGASKVSVSEWLPQWWSNHATINISALITAVVFPPALIVLIAFLIHKRKELISKQPGHLIQISIVLFFLVFWFIQYPNVRFGWSWILFAIVYAIIKTHQVYFRIPNRLLRMAALILFTLSLGRAFWKTIDESYQARALVVGPVITKQAEDLYTKQVGSYEIRLAKDMHCWGALPPCSPYYYEALEIVPRGDDFTDGFKVEN